MPKKRGKAHKRSSESDNKHFPAVDAVKKSEPSAPVVTAKKERPSLTTQYDAVEKEHEVRLAKQQQSIEQTYKELEGVRELFQDPVDLEKITDPVVASDGQMYQRGGTFHSLAKEGSNSAVLSEKLHSELFHPSIALRNIGRTTHDVLAPKADGVDAAKLAHLTDEFKTNLHKADAKLLELTKEQKKLTDRLASMQSDAARLSQSSSAAKKEDAKQPAVVPPCEPISLQFEALSKANDKQMVAYEKLAMHAMGAVKEIDAHFAKDPVDPVRVTAPVVASNGRMYQQRGTVESKYKAGTESALVGGRLDVALFHPSEALMKIGNAADLALDQRAALTAPVKDLTSLRDRVNNEFKLALRNVEANQAKLEEENKQLNRRINTVIAERKVAQQNSTEVVQQFHHCISRRQKSEVVQMLSRGTHVNSRDDSKSGGGITALHIAVVGARNSSMEMVHTVIEAKADPTAQTVTGFTPLLLLAANEAFDAQTVQLLISHAGARVAYLPLSRVEDVVIANAEKQLGGEKLSPQKVSHAREMTSATRVFEALLLAKADVNARTLEGYSSLHFAALSGRETTAEILLAHNADTEFKADGKTALDLARERKNVNVERCLVEHAKRVAARRQRESASASVTVSAASVKLSQ